MRDMLARQIASPKVLRPHQSKALDLLRASLGKGNRRVVIQAPTGFGKTLTAAKIVDGALAKGNRVIFTAPAVSLIDQTVEAFEVEGIDCIGVMQANHPRTDPYQPVQIASVQTLARRDIPDAALVIVDEAHIRSEVIDRLMDDRKDLFYVGLSATPWRKGMGLRWQDMVTPVTIGDLIEHGYLSKFTVYAPDVPDMTGVKVRAGEYVEEALARLMGDAKLVGNVVQNWLSHGDDRPTLCFAVNRAHAAALEDEFRRYGVSSAYVDAQTDRVERAHINRLFRQGSVRVICSVRTMTTGVDLPVSCIIDAAPTCSEMLHVQKIGRGLRVNQGTETCTIFDHAGNSLRLGLVTDIHYTELCKARPGEKPKAKLRESLPGECSKCGVVYTGVVCPSCGHERKPFRQHVDAVEGSLVAVSGKVKVSTKADKQLFWSMALWVDRERGKGRKLALALYKGRFGVWPRGLKDISTAPDQAFANYVTHSRIAYAKRKGKAG